MSVSSPNRVVSIPPGADRARPLRGVTTLALATLLALAGCADRGPTEPAAATPTFGRQPTSVGQERRDRVPGRVLMALRPGSAATEVAATQGVRLEREVVPGLWTVRSAPGSEATLARALARNPNVRFAEPDYLRSFDDPLCPSCTRPGDDLLEWQWNMHNDGAVDLGFGLVFQTEAVDADVDWLEAYDLLGPSPSGSVRIGVLDTGIRATHVDVCGKVSLQKNFYDGSANAADDHGHGTHVATTAGGCADNGGVVGIAYGPDMEFVIGKVCAADGTCAVSGIVEGLYWMADQGADVVNMSFGDVVQSQAEADALQYATDAGVLMACAAGNEGQAQIIYPAADPNCVAVVATNFGDRAASYSNRGPQAELAAPGGDLEDPVFGTSMITSAWAGWDTDYVATVGTSMATPHVTGLAALMHALGVPDAASIRACLAATADDLGTPGWDETFGHGRINVLAAVQAAQAGSACEAPPGGGNQSPTADFTVSCVDLDCTFDASTSFDPDGSLVTWSWDFGDGAGGSGEVVAHGYSTGGDRTVTLTVEDDGGSTHSTTRTASPRAPPEPLAIHVGALEGGTEEDRGNRWRASFRVRIDDADGAPADGSAVGVSWAGDAAGSGDAVTGGDGQGTFLTGWIKGGSSVTFTVESVSASGAVWDNAADVASSLTVTRGATANEPPTADFTWSCADLACDFTDRSADPDGTIASWSWDFAGLGSSTERDPFFPFPPPGPYAVTLTVTDDGGETSTVEKTILEPSGGGVTLSVETSKDKGNRVARLTWDGLDPADVYRDGALVAEAVAGGSWTDDTLGKGGQDVAYQVCAAGASEPCSGVVTAVF